MQNTKSINYAHQSECTVIKMHKNTVTMSVNMRFTVTFHPRGTPPSGELNTRGVAEYSDFGPIERCISETVQDRR